MNVTSAIFATGNALRGQQTIWASRHVTTNPLPRCPAAPLPRCPGG
ncbi:hypothetical protein RKD30_000881 [Streptomyces pristinaespiralis]